MRRATRQNETESLQKNTQYSGVKSANMFNFHERYKTITSCTYIGAKQLKQSMKKNIHITAMETDKKETYIYN